MNSKKKTREFFPGIAKIRYEGPQSKNPLAFKHYNADELVDNEFI
jgi:xylose isomerase